MSEISETSEIEGYMREIDQLISLEILFGDDDDEENLEELFELKAFVESYSTNERVPIEKPKGIQLLLSSYEENDFREMTRMSKTSYIALVQMLEGHRIFHKRSRKAQTEPWLQIFIVLLSFGCEGNEESIENIARFCGITHELVCTFTDRVVSAILSLHNKYIKWPDAVERTKISDRMYKKFGLKGAVGIVDGTPVNFSQRPLIDGNAYFTRKGRYSINVQIVCDDKKMIRSYLVGWPGSCADSTVFQESLVHKNPEIYFDNSQYLLADAGYGARGFICTPYKPPQSRVPENELFNTLHSRGLAPIDRLNGIWKNRWSSLKSLPIQVKEKEDFERTNAWIVTSMVLHNILMSMKDVWDDDKDEDIDRDIVERRDVHNIEGNQLRDLVKQGLQDWFSRRR